MNDNTTIKIDSYSADDISSLVKETFVVVTEEHCSELLSAFCDYVLQDGISNPSYEDVVDNGDIDEDMEYADENDALNSIIEDEDLHYGTHEEHSDYKHLLSILQSFPKPYTIVQEPYHIDKTYRSTYYMYFSNQHFDTRRYSKRLSFLKGVLNYRDFFAQDSDEADNKKITEKLQQCFIGATVINPLVTGAIGRTLINPKYLIEMDKRPCYVRLSDFKLHIMGRKVWVRAFPFREQDQETMRCAEITLLNLMEYYSNTYSDYKMVVPEDIITNEQIHQHERVLPSRGMSYPVLTKLLSEFGFSPRLYNLEAMDSFKLSNISQRDKLRRILYYYVESGIPVALNLVPLDNRGTGHSMVCIGHGKAKPELKKKAYRNRQINYDENFIGHPLINSADYFDDFVVIDDNQPVYQVRPFEQLSNYSEVKVENIAVPLYKRMFLDAGDAYAIISTLVNMEGYRPDDWNDELLKTNEPIVVRMFLSSSHSLKKFRTETLDSVYAKEIYTSIPMPRFVWVCEMYRVSDYENGLAFGEIVIDATSAANRLQRSLILMHYIGSMVIRFPDEKEAVFDEEAIITDDKYFQGYTNNLEIIKTP